MRQEGRDHNADIIEQKNIGSEKVTMTRTTSKGAQKGARWQQIQFRPSSLPDGGKIALLKMCLELPTRVDPLCITLVAATDESFVDFSAQHSTRSAEVCQVQRLAAVFDRARLLGLIGAAGQMLANSRLLGLIGAAGQMLGNASLTK
jgi:hypothetical protein